MSSPFQTQAAMPDPFAQRQAIIIHERGTHVPTFYVQHVNPQDITVTVDGSPLLPVTTVDQIAPERRWAVGPTGEMMTDSTFTETFKQVWLEWFRIDGARLGPGQRPETIPIPNVKRYISYGVDPRNPKNLVLIHRDEEHTGVKPRHFVDSDGEKVKGSRISHLAAAYDDPTLRPGLTEEELAEVEAYRGMKPPPRISGLVEKLATLNELLADGDITPEIHSKRVAALTGTALVVTSDDVEGEGEEIEVSGEEDEEEVDLTPEVTRNRRGRSYTLCGEDIMNVHRKKHAAECMQPPCVRQRIPLTGGE